MTGGAFCCARAASGHAAALLSSVMKSRRLIPLADMNLDDYSKETREMKWGSRLSVRGSNREPCMSVQGVRRGRRRFPVGENPTRQPLQPEATGAVMEETKWLKPSDSVSRNTVTARVCRP